MTISAQKEPLEFYSVLLEKGGYIEVGSIDGIWIQVKDQETLKRFYEADCLFRIPLNKEQEKILGSGETADAHL